MTVDYLAEALALASRFHAGQTDWAGRSYLEHICAVVAGASSANGKVVAALHDILEDTDCDVDQLQKLFPIEIVDAVVALTRTDQETYRRFIERVAENALATEVKLSDLAHNMDLSRIPDPQQKDFDRNRKYERAKERLLRAAADREDSASS
ncbi:MAG: GTP pyrophosphokinase [Pseudomonadota bacterium]